jgi:hypothetical protein
MLISVAFDFKLLG